VSLGRSSTSAGLDREGQTKIEKLVPLRLNTQKQLKELSTKRNGYIQEIWKVREDT
jgi:hypothetical protein